MSQPVEIQAKVLDRIVNTLLGQSGLGLVVAAVFAYACHTVYEDSKAKDRENLELMKSQVEASKAVSHSLVNLSTQIQHNTDAVTRLERKD